MSSSAGYYLQNWTWFKPTSPKRCKDLQFTQSNCWIDVSTFARAYVYWAHEAISHSETQIVMVENVCQQHLQPLSAFRDRRNEWWGKSGYSIQELTFWNVEWGCQLWHWPFLGKYAAKAIKNTTPHVFSRYSKLPGSPEEALPDTAACCGF